MSKNVAVFDLYKAFKLNENTETKDIIMCAHIHLSHSLAHIEKLYICRYLREIEENAKMRKLRRRLFKFAKKEDNVAVFRCISHSIEILQFRKSGSCRSRRETPALRPSHSRKA